MCVCIARELGYACRVSNGKTVNFVCFFFHFYMMNKMIDWYEFEP